MESNHDRTAKVAARAAKYVILGVGLPVTFFMIFAPDVIGLWMGQEFAFESTTPARLLLIGVFASAIARIPYGILQSFGKPDITAKLHLIEFPIFLGVLPTLTFVLGLPGAALAWSIRSILDLVLLLWMAHRHLGLSGDPLRAERIPGILLLLVVVGVSGLLLSASFSTIEHRALLAIGLGSTCVLGTWFLFVNAEDRETMMRLLRRNTP